jgi:RNA polymerase sigma-70 factor (ECF subfamily)
MDINGTTTVENSLPLTGEEAGVWPDGDPRPEPLPNKNLRTEGSPSEDSEDHGLVASVLSGDAQAHERLYLKYLPVVLNLIRRHVSDKTETEDLAQKVFISLFQNLSRFRGESKFFTWLYTITLNHIRSHYRSKAHRSTLSLDYGPPDPEAPRRQWRDPSATPEEVMETKNQLAMIVDALDVLHNEHRQIFELYYFKNKSIQEIADLLHRLPATVKVYLHRARHGVKLFCDKHESAHKGVAPPAVLRERG